MTSARPSAVVLYRQLARKGIADLLASKCVKHFGVPQVNEVTGRLSFAERAGSRAHSTRKSADYGVHLTESGFHRTTLNRREPPMENLNTDVQKMIEELNQYMLPSTLMECFDAWREEAYKQAIRSIPKSSLGWFLDMLNRFRGPEDRKESLFEVFDPSLFTVDHPAWQSPPGTVIELPALTSEIAAKADRESEFAEAAREEVREFREHADPYDDEELMQLGAIVVAGLGDQRRTFQNRDAVIRYLALNASPRMEDLWVSDDSEWLEAPRRRIEFPDMLAWRKEQLLRGDGPPSLREQELICYSEDEIRRFGLDIRSLFLHDRPRHLAICSRCQARLESWMKQLRDFDQQTLEPARRPEA
jgi:hypothetical protein